MRLKLPESEGLLTILVVSTLLMVFCIWGATLSFFGVGWSLVVAAVECMAVAILALGAERSDG